MAVIRVEQLLQKVTRASLEQRGFASHRLISDWPAIVGEDAAAYSLPQKLVFSNANSNDGVLHVAVESGWAVILQHMEPMILERIATYFGYRAVSRLVLRQQPLPRKKIAIKVEERPLTENEKAFLAEHVEKVQDAELKKTLYSIGGLLMQRRKTVL